MSVQWQVTGTSKCCFGGPFLGLFTDRNDREYPPPSTTTVGVAHESQASVSLMFLPHFDVFRDLFLEQTHSNMESIRLYHKQIDKRTWYRLTVPGFVWLFQDFFSKSQTLLFASASSFLLYLTSRQFLPNVLKRPHSPSGISAQTLFIFIAATRQDGNCSQLTVVRISPSFDIFYVPKNCFCLDFSVFLTCKKLLLKNC